MLKKLCKTLSRFLATLAADSSRTVVKARGFRPGVESLEDRLVPATILVNSFEDVAVPLPGQITLRSAISLANATATPDTIQLQAGVYKIRLAGSDNTNAAGDFDVTNTLTIVGKGAGRTVIEGIADRSDRLFNAVGTIGLTLNSMTLRDGGNGNNFGGAVQALTASITLINCVATNNFGLKGAAINAEAGNVTLTNTTLANNRAFSEGGGGIFAASGNVVLTDSTVKGNIARKGGGIFAGSGTVTLSHSTVARNLAREQGGGIFSETGTVNLLSNSAVRRNVAGTHDTSTPVGQGGGVFGRTVNVTASSVSGNTALRGSGGGIQGTTVTLTSSTVNNNIRGGIEATTVTVSSSTVNGNSDRSGISCLNVTLSNSTVSGNSGVIGGGILAGGTATLTRSTVSGNSAAGTGGGVFADVLFMTNSTVSGNTAGTGGTGDGGGGVFAVRGSILNSTIAENLAAFGTGGGVRTVLASADPLRVKNTIVADNLALDGPQDFTGAFLSQGNNLFGVLDGSSSGLGSNDRAGTATNPLDPLLGALAFNGGPTQTHALQAGSPAIDRGNNSGSPATDQRGLARVKDGDGNGSLIVDIGAFER